jgi:uncharacterized protein
MNKTVDHTIFGLPIAQVNIIYEILANYPEVKTVKVFGSRAKGNYVKLSDLDLVIIGGGQNRINKILGDIDASDFLWKVDIIGYDQAQTNPLLKSEIDTYSQDFWERV